MSHPPLEGNRPQTTTTAAAAEEELPPDNTSTGQKLAIYNQIGSFPGPYLRLDPLNLSALPAHNKTTQENAIASHVYAILSEARRVADRISTANSGKQGKQGIWHQTGTKKYQTVAAPIENWKTEVSREAILHYAAKQEQSSGLRNWDEYRGETEYWFARRSIHKDAAEAGTACWAEFVAGLRNEHSMNEKAYTHSIYDARLVLDFEQALGEAGLHSEIKGLTMKIYEMCHAVPLRNRVFATLVLTGSISDDEFVVAQFPVQLKGSAIGFYSNNKNQQEDNKSLTTAEMRKKVTVGQYVSVERCVRRPETNDIEWLMATASDAKGGVPMMVQRLAIPGTICKDVEYFLEWVAGRRGDRR